jgi:hypothetical protein
MNTSTLLRTCHLRLSLTSGLVLLAGGNLLQAQTPAPQVSARIPAARISRIQPVLGSNSPLITRGLTPEPSSAETKPDWVNGPTATAVKPSGMMPTVGTSVPVKKPSMVESSWKDFKNLFDTDTPRQQPAVTVKTPQPIQQVAYSAPSAQGVYAGPPAYRWYGWGTTTPGRNPHAPDGRYPRGSANWYAQTGATPGAFPVTVNTIGEPVVGAEPPAYTGGVNPTMTPLVMQPYTNPVPTVVTMPTGFTNTMTVPENGPVVLGSSEVPATVFVPNIVVPVMETTPVVPVFTPSERPTPVSVPTVTPPPIMNMPTAAKVEVPSITWTGSATDTVAFNGASKTPLPTINTTPVEPNVIQQAGQFKPVETPVKAPVVTPPVAGLQWSTPGAAPVVKPIATKVTLEDEMKLAVKEMATITEIRQTAPDKLLIRLSATSQKNASAAADILSKLPQVKAMTVDFLVKIAN